MSARGFGLGSNLGAGLRTVFSLFSFSSLSVNSESFEPTSSVLAWSLKDCLAVGTTSTANVGHIGSLKLSFS